MPMPVDQAYKIVLLERKLYKLRENAPADQEQKIDAQLARLDPYSQEADDLVMTASDDNFKNVAKALQQQIKPINDAIADISKISAAITTAAQVIDGIIRIVGAIAK